jgi:hypothetical protein
MQTQLDGAFAGETAGSEMDAMPAAEDMHPIDRALFSVLNETSNQDAAGAWLDTIGEKLGAMKDTYGTEEGWTEEAAREWFGVSFTDFLTTTQNGRDYDASSS